MKIVYYFILNIAGSCFHVVQSFFDLQEVIKMGDFHQISTFVSCNLTASIDKKIQSLFKKFPCKIHSFNKNKKLSNTTLKNISLKNKFSLQESLIMFYTSDLKEIQLFINSLVSQLSIKKRPNCLIIYSKNSINEMDVFYNLEYAWGKKFLDFTVLTTNDEENQTNSSMFLFFFNPFKNVYVKKTLIKDIKIFPDKLRDACGYPFYISYSNYQWNNTHIKSPNHKVKIGINDYYTINYAAKTLNLDIKTINVAYEPPLPADFLQKWKLDLHSKVILNGEYSTYFLIPADKLHENVVAFVPIIPISEGNVFFEVSFKVIIVFGIITICLYLFSYLKPAVGFIGMFDFIRVFFGQPITRTPPKTVHRIILLTIMIATVKLMNDFLLNILLDQVEKKEIPFETYKDLYDSRLKTYTDLPYLRTQRVTEDPYLLKVLNKTGVAKSVNKCFEDLRKWKNASCITIPHDAEYTTLKHLNSDRSPIIKVAEPQIFEMPPRFYWFADCSPYG